MRKILWMMLAASVSLSSCKNSNWEFDDYEFQSVYFAYQGPVRTITLGEDVFDTSLDNEHKCDIMATLGGVYENKKDVTIGVSVDNSIAANMAFNSGGNIIPMPSNYYTLASDKIVIPKGEITGGIQVQLTDAFFADPLSLKNTYVIPLKMMNVTNADSMLAGKNYVLYALKYINSWHGNYLRRGKDVVTGKNGNNALNKTITRHQKYVEDDEVSALKTRSLAIAEFPVIFKDQNNQNITCKLLLNFDGSGNCTITNGDNTFTASGSGKFLKRGEKNSWGAKDRDALYLQYEVDLTNMHVSSADTLVMRDRGVKMETFTPVSQ
ncbi:DUF5627 domain-containing protein [Pararcticibacter amylolyticus]|uniref:Adhesin n=1 Tax=Pararcticibacter amylolyticus TaxID=2173175 RepID=A0A2U2PIV7_9SPHI|nr:DUF5627 domain-containing protein [Pararcticibacter amylolyticus]PWG81321.1 adhesin [Pararcticibacter amylolyticus]